MLAVLLGQLCGFAGSLTQVIQLCPACFAASSGLDIDYAGRVKREYPFDTFACHNPSDRERGVNAPAFAGDDRAREYADSLFVALSYSARNVNYVPDFEMRYIFLEALAFHLVEQLCLHFFDS
jgi:hypothetical protein